MKVDVQACFDTIDQNKLLGILKHLISEVGYCQVAILKVIHTPYVKDVYMMHRHGQVTESFGRIRRAYVKKAVPAGQYDSVYPSGHV